MRTYTRINEDYLDNSTIDTEDISMHDEICSEIDRWIHEGIQPSFDVQRLPDGFYKPVAYDSLDNLELLKQVITAACKQYGYECSLNWIDISYIDNMIWLFNDSMFNGDISRWDVSNVTNMTCMFYGSNFNGNISEWNVSNVTNMYCMFKGSKFNGNISEWDVSSVENMQAMFKDSYFNGNISGWDVSRVKNMNGMFRDSAINCDLSGWNVSNVRFHDDMFTRCPLEHMPDRQPKFKVNEDFLDKHDVQIDSINIIDDVRAELDNWIRYGKEPSFNLEILPDGFYPVNDKSELYKLIYKAEKLIGLNCSLNWIDVSKITDMEWLFSNSSFNGDISRWDVSSVENMQGMFYWSKFNGDVSEWDVSKVENMQGIFNHCPFCHDISMWNCASMEPGALKRALQGSKLPEEFKPKVC